MKAMADAMVHRGPDDEGYFTSGSLALGFRRLSIIDLGGGHQPMCDAEGSVWVVFNGEIYNFAEVREELERCGHVFRTRSDTEVFVHGYKHWGKEVLQHLNGMFGVAIWDERKRELMLARDRLGIKFVYYRLTSDKIAFASEIKPLFACMSEGPEINPLSVSMFLRYRFTPSPYTIYKGVNKLPPGTRLIISEQGPPVLESWWAVPPDPFEPMLSANEAEEQLTCLYAAAVKRHLISDVPLGLLLSGGMDSALLLALMKQHGDSWNTYTVGYGRSFKDDELQDAARTAQLLHSPNYSVELGVTDFERSLHEVLASLEEPIATSSVVPMYHVAKRAREDVKVAFVGQGPDELFGGYTRHMGVLYGAHWRSLPTPIRELLAAGLAKVPRGEWLKRGLRALPVQDRLRRYQEVLSIISGESTEALFWPGVLPAAATDQVLECWKDLRPLIEVTDELGGLQILEICSSLPDELLMYADKLSMAHSLEVRVPYLDYEIVEFVERLRASLKIRHGKRKWLHRKVSARFLPPEIIGRKKRGFAVNVVDDWFRRSLSKETESLLLDTDSLVYQILNPEPVAKLLRDHKNGHQDNHKLLFSLIVLEVVLRSCRSWSVGATALV